MVFAGPSILDCKARRLGLCETDRSFDKSLRALVFKAEERAITYFTRKMAPVRSGSASLEFTDVCSSAVAMVSLRACYKDKTHSAGSPSKP